jgi:hypothetical protein
MAAVVDVSEPIREATYNLEGDGPLAILVYSVIEKVRLDFEIKFDMMEYTNVNKAIKICQEMNVYPPGFDNQNSNDISIDAAWREHAKKGCQRCREYFNVEVLGHENMDLYKAAEMCSPEVIQRLNAREVRIRLETFMVKAPSLITQELIDQLVRELAEYIRISKNINYNNCTNFKDIVDKIHQFWTNHRSLKSWTKFAHLCYLLQPSSSCVERAFSSLKYLLGDQQSNSYNDRTECSAMLGYNARKRSKVWFKADVQQLEG